MWRGGERERHIAVVNRLLRQVDTGDLQQRLALEHIANPHLLEDLGDLEALIQQRQRMVLEEVTRHTHRNTVRKI